MKTLLEYCFVLVFINLHNYFFFRYCYQILRPRFTQKWYYILIPFILSQLSLTLIVLRVFIPLSYVIIFVVYWTVFRILFKDSLFSILFVCLNNTFNMLILRDLTIAVFSLIFNQSMYQVTRVPELNILSLGVTRLLMLILDSFLYKTSGYRSISSLLEAKKGMTFIILTKATLLLIMLNLDCINYYYVDNIKLTGMNLLNYFFAYGCYYFLHTLSGITFKWSNQEMTHELTLLQLKHQKELYEKQSQSQELQRIYNHDYKDIMQNSINLLNRGDTKGAKKLLNELNVQIDHINQQTKRYSNSLIVDAILNDLDHKCLKEGIKFTGECYIPENMPLCALQLSQIFNNISNNSFEACMRQPEYEHRWIHIKSYVQNHMLIIFAQNSYNGALIIENNKFMTSKTNKRLHGIGLESIKYTIGKLNGMVLIKTDHAPNVFKLLIKLTYH
ncbi:two-component sensor histidine kinase [Lachnospiraceae bacterium KM106-2]|nr:two-component sensor histidine kinase [Lachnospiraceae bacterium KM106-2]